MIVRRTLGRASVMVGIAFLVGCQTWQTVSVTPGTPAFEGRATEARVTYNDGVVATLTSALAFTDTILGTSPSTGLVVRTPAAAVRTLEVRRHSRTRTVSLLVAHASLVVSVIALVIHVQPHYRGAF